MKRNLRRAFLDTIKESTIVQAIKDYLAAEGIRFIRIHAGKVNRGPHWLHLAPAGTPDFVIEIPARRPVRPPSAAACDKGTSFCAVARIAWIEAKRPTGNRLSVDQEAFRVGCCRRGSFYYLVRTPEDLRFFIPPLQELRFEQWSDVG